MWQGYSIDHMKEITLYSKKLFFFFWCPQVIFNQIWRVLSKRAFLLWKVISKIDLPVHNLFHSDKNIISVN